MTAADATRREPRVDRLSGEAAKKRTLWIVIIVLSGLFGSAAQPATAQQTWDCVSEVVTYQSGQLRIFGILWRPNRTGKFPVLLYNHGSRPGRERQPFLTTDVRCWQMVTGTDLVILWPERRGYWGSDGPTYAQELGPFEPTPDFAKRAIGRLYAEADDVLAGLDFLESRELADVRRVAIMGHSLGGIVSIFAASKAPKRFHAVIDQAGGFQPGWIGYDMMRDELIAAARKLESPLLIQHASNDTFVTPDVSRQLFSALRAVGKPVQYEELPSVVLDGHGIFFFGERTRHWWSQVNVFIKSAWGIP